MEEFVDNSASLHGHSTMQSMFDHILWSHEANEVDQVICTRRSNIKKVYIFEILNFTYGYYSHREIY